MSTVDEVRALVAAASPERGADEIVKLGEGRDNVAYEVGGRLVVRFAKAPDPARLRREAGLLRRVADVSPLPVPVPVFTVPERGCLAYEKLPGTPVARLAGPAGPAGHGPALVTVLAGFLRVIQAIPVASVEGLCERDDPPLEDRLAEATASWPGVRDRVPVRFRRSIERFLASPVPGGRRVPVFSHNDLGTEHVLADRRTWAGTGIIDWSDAGIVDPAYDYGKLYRDLGPVALSATPGDLRERAGFYARCGMLEELEYDEHTSRAPLDWLFPA